MSQDKEARDVQIKDLKHLVMPAILLKQFRITYAPVPSGRTINGQPVFKTDDKPMLQPVAVELFAMCSPTVSAALDSMPQGKTALKLQDWRSELKRKVVSRYKIQGFVSK
jgi:hypothetical protein